MNAANLFKNIAQRLYSENNLSDMTWAFMMSCEKFKDVFLTFCFDETPQNVKEISREYADDDSRPDFHFYDGEGIEYLIEIKIYDHNQHFEQYDKRFPNARKSFLSNYPLTGADCALCSNEWKKKEWPGFVPYLSNELHNFEQDDRMLIESYLVYLKNVIEYEEVETMNLKEVCSLSDFYKCISRVVKENGFELYPRLTSAFDKDTS